MGELTQTTPTPRKQSNWVSDLAFEVALQYFTPEQLQLRYELDADQFNAIVARDSFQRLVLSHQRDIDENGTQFRVLARKLASVNLAELHHIARDPTASHTDRISAVKALASFGGLDKSEAGQQGNTQFALQINFSDDRTVTVQGGEAGHD